MRIEMSISAASLFDSGYDPRSRRNDSSAVSNRFQLGAGPRGLLCIQSFDQHIDVFPTTITGANSATRHLPSPPLSNRNAVSTWATTVAELPRRGNLFDADGIGGQLDSANRAIRRRASLGVRSPAARVVVMTIPPVTTRIINEVISRFRFEHNLNLLVSEARP